MLLEYVHEGVQRRGAALRVQRSSTEGHTDHPKELQPK